jgi:hypothetical protein
VNYLLIRRHPDGAEETSDADLGLDFARVGATLPSNIPGKVWQIIEIDGETRPLPTVVMELVDDRQPGVTARPFPDA